MKILVIKNICPNSYETFMKLNIFHIDYRWPCMEINEK